MFVALQHGSWWTDRQLQPTMLLRALSTNHRGHINFECACQGCTCHQRADWQNVNDGRRRPSGQPVRVAPALHC
eukprot:670479-Prorocentrum_lima.AAC.1